MYLGTLMFFDKSYNLISTPLRKHDGPTDKMTMNTIIFTTFFLMNMMNQINSRIVNDNEVNVLKTLFNNPIFWFVLLVEMAVTHGMLFLGKTKFGTAVLGVTSLTGWQYAICWILALLTIPLAILTKKVIPIKPFVRLMARVDLEPTLPWVSYVMKFYHSLIAIVVKSNVEVERPS